MAWTSEKHIRTLIEEAKKFLTNINILHNDIGQHRAIIDLEGIWKEYRIIVSEVHRKDKGIRYAYYVLDKDNILIQGFDNSTDIVAIKLKYGKNWKSYIHEEVPHQHDREGNLSLTQTDINFETFRTWIYTHLRMRKWF